MKPRVTTVALLLAAGSGERLGAGEPKAFVELAGKPLLQWSVDVLVAAPEIHEIVVALPPKCDAPSGTVGVIGGATRSESVRNALSLAPPSALVLVHDAARPLLSIEIVQAVLRAVTEQGVDAAVAAAPVTDTIKSALPIEEQQGEGTSRANSARIVRETLRREELWAVQTPQAFKRRPLEEALAQPVEVISRATDDASLIERAGGTVALVPCTKENIKVTTPLDLELACLLLGRREP